MLNIFLFISTLLYNGSSFVIYNLILFEYMQTYITYKSIETKYHSKINW